VCFAACERGSRESEAARRERLCKKGNAGWGLQERVERDKITLTASTQMAAGTLTIEEW
jgi:hypothetical protein